MSEPVSYLTLSRVVTPGTPRWSPDGERLVFAAAFADYDRNAAGSALWLLPCGGGPAVPLTPGRAADGAPVHDTLPCWSPDGRRVAFCSNRGGRSRVWSVSVAGGDARLLLEEDPGCGPVLTDPFHAGLEWHPDGTRLVFAAPLAAPPDPEGAGRPLGRDYGETYPHVRARIHLWSLPAAGGRPTRLTHGDHDHGDPRWSPDGGHVLCVSNRSGDEGPVSSSINKPYDLCLLPAAGGEVRVLTDNPGPDFSPRWSPDGRYVAYLSGLRCGPHRDHYRLRLLEPATGHVRELPDAGLPEPLAAQCWSPEGQTLYFSAWTGTETQLFACPAAGGEPRPLTGGRQVHTAPAASPDGSLLAATAADAESLPEVRLHALPSGLPAGTTALNAWLGAYRLAPQRVVTWESEGWTVEGVLVRPPAVPPAAPAPTLLFSHGGPHHRVTCALSLEWQALAAAGFAVLAPNFRGSAGYGAEFLDADRGDWGGGDFRDLMRGLDALVEAGQADPGRLGCFGGSYGGYMTCWTLTRTHRFRAAVARAPITHLHSYYGTTDLKTLTGWDLEGAPWEQPERYRERSPLTHAPEVRTPLLLLHGDADRRVPYSQSEELHAALTTLGVPVELVRYPGEGHLIARPRHVRDYWQRTLAWFERYLHPAPCPGDDR